MSYLAQLTFLQLLGYGAVAWKIVSAEKSRGKNSPSQDGISNSNKNLAFNNGENALTPTIRFTAQVKEDKQDKTDLPHVWEAATLTLPTLPAISTLRMRLPTAMWYAHLQMLTRENGFSLEVVIKKM
jgi:hypothetical protein